MAGWVRRVVDVLLVGATANAQQQQAQEACHPQGEMDVATRSAIERAAQQNIGDTELEYFDVGKFRGRAEAPLRTGRGICAPEDACRKRL